MKRIAVFFVTLIAALSVAVSAFALDSDYALNYEKWSSQKGTKTITTKDNDFNATVKYYVDETNRTIYVHVSYTADDMLEKGNHVMLFYGTENSTRSITFQIDKGGIKGAPSSEFKCVQDFGEISSYGQEITFAVEYLNKLDYSENRVTISLMVNGITFVIMNDKIALRSATTTQTTTKAPEKTTKAGNNDGKTTTQASGTTKFTPPEDADYFTSEAASDEDISEPLTNEDGSLIVEPDNSAEKSLSNPAKIILGCAALAAIIGAALLAKAAISKKKKGEEEQPAEETEPIIDEEAKEVIDENTDDEFDTEE